MDDDPGHSCGSLLRLCAICSTFTLLTFGCCCDSCTPFSYSSSAESIRLSVQPCIHPSVPLVSAVMLHGKGSSGSAPKPGQTSLQASDVAQLLLDRPGSQEQADTPAVSPQGRPCQRVLCPAPCAQHEPSLPAAAPLAQPLRPSDRLFLSQCWSF